MHMTCVVLQVHHVVNILSMHVARAVTWTSIKTRISSLAHFWTGFWPPPKNAHEDLVLTTQKRVPRPDPVLAQNLKTGRKSGKLTLFEVPASPEKFQPAPRGYLATPVRHPPRTGTQKGRICACMRLFSYRVFRVCAHLRTCKLPRLCLSPVRALVRGSVCAVPARCLQKSPCSGLSR